MKQSLWRIYTEDKGNIESFLKLRGINSATILKGEGYWEGSKEQSVVVEIITNDQNEADAYDSKVKALSLASAIKLENEQQAVLVTQTVIDEMWVV